MSSKFGGVKIIPDETLEKIIGKSKISPTLFTKKVWAYVKKHNLMRGKYVIPDKLLSSIVGRRKLSFTSFTKKIFEYAKKKNLIERTSDIRTIIDDFYELILSEGKIGMVEASLTLGVSLKEIEEWANALEDYGLIKIVYTPFGVRFEVRK